MLHSQAARNGSVVWTTPSHASAVSSPTTLPQNEPDHEESHEYESPETEGGEPIDTDPGPGVACEEPEVTMSPLKTIHIHAVSSQGV